MYATLLLCHVLAAIGVGPILVLPLLANNSAALQTVLVSLRFGAGATLVSGILLWVVLKPANPIWLYVSFALFVAVVATILFVLEPAVKRASEESRLGGRVRFAGIASSAFVFGITALMVLRPG